MPTAFSPKIISHGSALHHISLEANNENAVQFFMWYGINGLVPQSANFFHNQKFPHAGCLGPASSRSVSRGTERSLRSCGSPPSPSGHGRRHPSRIQNPPPKVSSMLTCVPKSGVIQVRQHRVHNPNLHSVFQFCTITSQCFL